MSLVSFDRYPTDRQLRNFGLALGVVAGLIAWRMKMTPTGAVILVACTVVALLAPKAFRRPYVVLCIVTWPLGLVVSWVILLLIWCLLVTPLGVLSRLAGRDVLQLRRRNADSYWHSRASTPPIERYFRPW